MKSKFLISGMLILCLVAFAGIITLNKINKKADATQTNNTSEAAAGVKTKSTFYAEAKVAAARSNIAKYSWAKSARDAAVSNAEKYMGLGGEFLWNAVSTQGIPRSYAFAVTGSKQQFNCLNCGSGIKGFGNYPFLANPINEPWKLECPSCHHKFPTNDFGAYYKSGLDQNGNFVAAKADRSLLKNTLYPEKGEDWGVDDGFGYIDGSYKYTFIAYYNHWVVWYGKTGQTPALISTALNSLRDAYIYTGDVRYARTGAVLLDRIADVYPSMNTYAYPVSTGFLQSDGGIGGYGKIVGCIWETGLVKDFIRAYDAFFPALEDPEIISFLSAKANQYKMANRKTAAADIRKNIENGILRQVYPAIRNSQIRGNNGMHQSALALAAVVLDSMPETKEWLDFNFQAGGFLSNPYRVTGGNILATLVNDVDRDGHGNEAAPGYNKLWLSQYLETADILDGYELYPEADLFSNVKFRKMFTAMYPLMLSDNFSANIGDTGSTGNPGNFASITEIIRAYEKYQDPIFAQVAYYLNGNKAEGIHGDIFSQNPDAAASSIKNIIALKGPLKLNSTNLTGYGFTALSDQAAADAQRSVWMYYGRNDGHGHRDTLNLGLTAFKLDLSPDLGYPEAADDLNAHRHEWVNNTISHNTVIVNKTKQNTQWVSQPKHFDDTEMVKLIDVEAPDVYPQAQLYRRTSALIKIDGLNSYIVDFFRVKGGNDHHFSFHGPEGAVTTEGLELVNQLTGTYAGPDTAFPGNDYKYSGASGYKGSGFQWLKNVQRDEEPADIFSVDWNAKDTWNQYRYGAKADTDVHLRLTMLGAMEDIALADGIPPQVKAENPDSIKYVVAHRKGENLSSLFTSVIEPYKGERLIESIAPALLKVNGQAVSSDDARAVKVLFKDGRTDYVIYSLDNIVTYTVDDKFRFKGFFGVYSQRNGDALFAYMNDGTEISEKITAAQGRFTGSVVKFSKEMSSSNEITVQLNETVTDPAELAGRYIYIKNDGKRNACYEIKGIKSAAGRSVTFDIGDITLIRTWKNANDFSQGYIYDISEGAEFVIPLSILANEE